MPEQLKPYLLPIVALLLVAAWFLIIQPMMKTSEPAPDDASTKKATDAK